MLVQEKEENKISRTIWNRYMHFDPKIKVYFEEKEENLNLDFDYLVKTDISTFWDFDNLHRYIDELKNGPSYYLSETDILIPTIQNSENIEKHNPNKICVLDQENYKEKYFENVIDLAEENGVYQYKVKNPLFYQRLLDLIYFNN